MKKIILIVSFLLNALFAQDFTKDLPFYATLMKVDFDDVLNVRQKPSFSAKKIGYIGNWSKIDVIKCKRVTAKSIWCKVGLFDSDDKSELPTTGWVNAKFLYGHDIGYVAINGKKDCYYSLGCFEGKCKVVFDIIGDLRYPKALKVKELPKKSLKSLKAKEASFDNDLCTISETISTFIDTHKPIYAYPKNLATLFYEKFRVQNYSNLDEFIHPTKGVLISYFNTFGKKDIHLSKDEFKRQIKSNSKIYWGKKGATKINLSLKEFFKNFQDKFPPHSHYYALRVSTKGLKFLAKNIVAYKIEPQKSNGYERRLTILIQKYKNRYYIVGLIYTNKGAKI